MTGSTLVRSLAPLALVLAAGCGGGPKHVSEITPQVSQRLTGVWVLNERESDDPEEALRMAGGDRGAPSGGRPSVGGRPPMGGGGGMTGGGMTGGGRAGGRRGSGGMAPPARLSPEAMMILRRMATVAPRRLEIALSDSSVVVSAPREEPWMLLFGEKTKRMMPDSVEVEARAEWEEGRVVVTRKVSGGGEVTETYMPSLDGSRMVVAVTFSPGGRGGVEFRRVYYPG